MTCGVQGDREDALGLARRAADELPALEEVGGAELDAAFDRLFRPALMAIVIQKLFLSLHLDPFYTPLLLAYVYPPTD